MDISAVIQMDDSSDTFDSPMATSAESVAESDQCTTITDQVQAKLFKNLSAFLEKEKGLALFACGGAIPIADHEQSSSEEALAAEEKGTAQCTSLPISLRWDAPDGKTPCGNTKLNFPLDEATGDNLDHLLAAAQPASFGRGGQDVFDETYRKALKLDTTEFSTTFNPYELGIVDTVAQLLLPSAIDSRTFRAVRAELYKLNVYSGPSGKFKPHVDTPRSQHQFASLVVCLPVDHEGGQLMVRHKGRDFSFDWSTAKDEVDHGSIRWAAFYSDCEHEVLEVTSGHRVTLTYNLYAVRGNGSLAGYCPTLDASHLPLYRSVEALLQDARFMEHGGYLGLFCNHAYAHSAESGDLLPDTLKGLDMVMWETFRSLGVTARIRPVIKMSKYELATLAEERWDNKQPIPEGFVGRGLQLAILSNTQVEGMCEEAQMYAKWEGKVKYKDVTWLNKPTQEERQLVFWTYGNEASVGCRYSHCAIIVQIPPFKSRCQGGEQSTSAASSADGEEGARILDVIDLTW